MCGKTSEALKTLDFFDFFVNILYRRICDGKMVKFNTLFPTTNQYLFNRIFSTYQHKSIENYTPRISLIIMLISLS